MVSNFGISSEKWAKIETNNAEVTFFETGLQDHKYPLVDIA